MSRIANSPVVVPAGVEAKIVPGSIEIKGSKTHLHQPVHAHVKIELKDGHLTFVPKTKADDALAGTLRAIVANMVKGVTTGFEKRLTLVGVGYRAQVAGKALKLSLGFSHPVEYAIPEGIHVDCPSQTEVVIKGASKQQVGQVAADIRGYRPPEPYKGKGVRYSTEVIKLKEGKKK